MLEGWASEVISECTTEVAVDVNPNSPREEARLDAGGGGLCGLSGWPLNDEIDCSPCARSRWTSKAQANAMLINRNFQSRQRFGSTVRPRGTGDAGLTNGGFVFITAT